MQELFGEGDVCWEKLGSRGIYSVRFFHRRLDVE